ncbi:NAD-dependent epimerase/dehydratase family protein [Flavobacterium sp. 1355]|uniref:NAD-dependent epimerase/dehydratase family protein n=1 Tax=Flavobacterium sp. 1355 TaxID=2806571 RepID=UPI001AE2F272|nr:NAD-dependent epimerase/dehydratase family protein [Flavobacterium sp. 1355]MBP1224028.1 nucleoside-diphosphate-sugar epimerase [Flavobacterium sp. 1355]
MKKIIITGASGFVGENLYKYLDDIYRIEPISVRYIENQEFDLKANAIVHLAGKAHDLKNVSNPTEYYEANCELTKQLFDSFLNSEASVFVFLSTVKAVADEVHDILTEESIPNPKTHYGIAKRKAEEYILSKQLPSGKRIYILRPCMIHGPGNKGNLNLLYQLVSKGIPWPLGDFKNQRSFLSIENLCFIIKEILENPSIRSGVYQILDNEPISTNELVNLIGQSLNKKNRILKIPSSIIKKIAKIGDYLHLPLNSERLQKLTENYIASNYKITNAIGKPLPITAKEGLLKTFKSFKE